MIPLPAVPEMWERGNIRLFAQMKSGHTPSRSMPEYWENTDIPWFTLADVWQLRDGRQTYLGETANTINELGLANSAAELLPAGTVVLSRTASVGFSGIMPHPMATSQDFWNWICGPKLLPEYLNYQFKSMGPVFKSLNMGSTHQTIYQKDAASLQIVVPPLEEQRAIAHYLDRETARIDRLILEQQRLIEMLRERRQDLIRAAVLGDENPFAPSAAAAFTAIGHHFSVTLGKMLDAGKVVRSDDQLLPYIRAGNIQDSGLRLGDVNEMPYSAAEAANLNLLAGDLLVVEGGAVGTNVLIREDMPGWSFQKTVNRLRPLDDWSSAWLGYVLRTYRDIGVIDIVCNKSTIAHLTAEKLRAMRVPSAPPAEQLRVVALLDQETARIDELIAEAERFVELSRERRAALITAAVTGQIDVREVA
ncbi:restriction endonuclease subunit S [Nocardioides dilutus]